MYYVLWALLKIEIFILFVVKIPHKNGCGTTTTSMYIKVLIPTSGLIVLTDIKGDEGRNVEIISETE